MTMTTSSKILSTTYAPLVSQVLLTVVPKLFCVDPTIQYYHYHLHPRLPSPWTKACQATGGVGPAFVGDGVKATSSWLFDVLPISCWGNEAKTKKWANPLTTSNISLWKVWQIFVWGGDGGNILTTSFLTLTHLPIGLFQTYSPANIHMLITFLLGSKPLKD